MKKGFTLIELAIVLAIIGLLVGSIAAGRNLIRNSEVKATITQVDRYRSAVSAFDEKYGNLPGDLSGSKASNLGFTSRAGTAGHGDSNGFIDGAGGIGSVMQGGGETGLFWADLTSANGMNVNLIDGSFTTPNDTSTPTNSLTGVNLYLPAAQLGRANYFYVYESRNINYFGLSAIISMANGVMSTAPTLPVWEAYQIDQKVDDGYPQSGIVIAEYVDLSSVYWAAGGGGYGGGYTGTSDTSATNNSAYTCYDNGGSANTIQQYSLSYNSGKNNNCALSFAF